VDNLLTKTLPQTEGRHSELAEIEIISTKHTLDALSEEWNELIEEADVHIYQTFEWLRVWWKYFGSGKELHIIVFRADSRIIGIAPMFIDKFSVMGKNIYRCLRFIGSKVMQPKGGSFSAELAFSDYLSLIIRPGFETEVNRMFQKYINMHNHLFDEVLFEEVPEESTLLTGISTGDNNSGWEVTVENASVCPLINLPESWDELLAGLSSNARYQIRRFVKRITEKGIFKIHTAETPEEVKEAFEKLVVFHQNRWHSLGQPGIFMDERVLGFFREVTLELHKRGWLLMKTITADEKCVAVDLLYDFKGTIYMVQRGFDDSSEYESDSPGSVLLYYVIKEAIEDGRKIYDFLRGEENYKKRTANHLAQNKNMLLQKSNGRQVVNHRSLAHWCRNYAHAKQKIANERDIFTVHIQQNSSLSGIKKYVQYLYNRSLKRIK